MRKELWNESTLRSRQQLTVGQYHPGKKRKQTASTGLQVYLLPYMIYSRTCFALRKVNKIHNDLQFYKIVLTERPWLIFRRTLWSKKKETSPKLPKIPWRDRYRLCWPSLCAGAILQGIHAISPIRRSTKVNNLLHQTWRIKDAIINSTNIHDITDSKSVMTSRNSIFPRFWFT
jgi:hypothetical protein